MIRSLASVALDTVALATVALAIILLSGTLPAIADTSAMADSLFKSADSLDIIENYKAASAKYLELITKVRQTDPGNPKILRAQARLAHIYVLTKKFDEAEPPLHVLTHLDRSKLAIDPELMIDLDDLSDAYAQLKTDPHYGYEGLKRCIALRKFVNPNHPRLHDGYADLSLYCKQCGNIKESIEWTLKAIAQEKTFPLHKHGSWVGDDSILADSYIKLNTLDKAQQAVQEGLSVQARCKCGIGFLPQLHVNMARVYMRRGQFSQADKELQLAEKTTPPTGEFKQDLARMIQRYRNENDMMRRQTQAGAR